MDKREFLKTSGALVASSMLSSLLADEQKGAPRKNWAGNYQYSTERLHLPNSVQEVQKIVKSCNKIKALGTRHSFNGIADSPENQISLKNLTEMSLDRESRTVTVGAGVRYGQLAPYLYSNGFALHNLASLPHISVAGACATATHGSGSQEWQSGDGCFQHGNCHGRWRGGRPLTGARWRAAFRGPSSVLVGLES